jgi:hypothetical protein
LGLLVFEAKEIGNVEMQAAQSRIQGACARGRRRSFLQSFVFRLPLENIVAQGREHLRDLAAEDRVFLSGDPLVDLGPVVR